jgi:tetratricopeptide repeat protein
MVVLAGRQKVAAGEMLEWQEDVAGGIGSRIVLLKVPAGWGRSTVLDWFAEQVSHVDGGPVTFVFRVAGAVLPEGRGSQAVAVRGSLAEASAGHPVARALGLDRPAGVAVLALGAGSLFMSGFGLLAGVLGAQEAVTAAGSLWDASQAGQTGELARVARAAARVSAQVLVVVLIDDADCLDTGLAVTLLENLMCRDDGKMLVVAAANPGGELARALGKGDRLPLAGRVYAVDADPDMGRQARTDLVRELCPGLDDGLARRIGQRTAAFADVFAVAAAERITELRPGSLAAVAVVDAVIETVTRRPPPSAAAVVVSWAGGVVHARQLDRALAITGQMTPSDDRDLQRSDAGGGPIMRLADPASPRFAAPVAALAARVRQEMAAAVVQEALAIGADPAEPVVGRIVAGRAGHRVRGDLAGEDLGGLVRVQHDLVAALEEVGDLAEAAEIAAEALAGCPAGGTYSPDRDELAAAVLRLACAAPPPDLDPLVRELADEAVAGGAATGLEARIWAAASLLRSPGRREDGGRLAEQAAADLDSHGDLGPQATMWRLQLAVQAGRAGRLDIMQRLLAPLLSGRDDDLRDLAMRVLHAADDPHADIRLGIALLDAELRAGPANQDDLLRLHHALASANAMLGEYRHALSHVRHEILLRNSLQGASHADTLAARDNLADWTGEAGDPAAARDLYVALLPDLQRVLGTEHPNALAARASLADWTGEAGDPAAARDLYAALLPVIERVAGAEFPNALAARHNLARWAGEAGDPAAARDLYAALLPVHERVLGPEHPGTLTNRNNLAAMTGLAGDPAAARDLFAALLPVRERVLGPEHPETLETRGNLADSTGLAGDPAAARDLFAALLPVIERVLGAEHPKALTARNNLADMTGLAGDPAAARDLFAALLPVIERVLGPQHPETLTTRANIAAWTGNCGDRAGALRLYRELLPDRERVLGAEHPETLTTRANIAAWTGNCGDPAGALRLSKELLPDRERVLGPEHPHTLATRAHVAAWTGQCGDPAGALRLSKELLPDLERILGPEHSGTLATRNNIEYWACQAKSVGQ